MLKLTTRCFGVAQESKSFLNKHCKRFCMSITIAGGVPHCECQWHCSSLGSCAGAALGLPK
eukprot:4099345-Amphidinium_carterae.2